MLQEELNDKQVTQHSAVIVDNVFRTMHTIKGSAPMFGFERLVDYSLPVEKVYRRLRESNGHIDGQLIQKTIDVVDHILGELQKEDAHLPQNNEEKQILLDYFNNINRLNEPTNDR